MLSCSQSPAANLEKQSEPHLHRDGRTAVSRRRHNSSDGFFNNGSLRAPTGQRWKPVSHLIIYLNSPRSCWIFFLYNRVKVTMMGSCDPGVNENIVLGWCGKWCCCRVSKQLSGGLNSWVSFSWHI